MGLPFQTFRVLVTTLVSSWLTISPFWTCVFILILLHFASVFPKLGLLPWLRCPSSSSILKSPFIFLLLRVRRRLESQRREERRPCSLGGSLLFLSIPLWLSQITLNNKSLILQVLIFCPQTSMIYIQEDSSLSVSIIFGLYYAGNVCLIPNLDCDFTNVCLALESSVSILTFYFSWLQQLRVGVGGKILILV